MARDDHGSRNEDRTTAPVVHRASRAPLSHNGLRIGTCGHASCDPEPRVASITGRHQANVVDDRLPPPLRAEPASTSIRVGVALRKRPSVVCHLVSSGASTSGSTLGPGDWASHRLAPPVRHRTMPDRSTNRSFGFGTLSGDRIAGYSSAIRWPTTTSIVRPFAIAWAYAVKRGRQFHTERLGPPPCQVTPCL